MHWPPSSHSPWHVVGPGGACEGRAEAGRASPALALRRRGAKPLCFVVWVYFAHGSFRVRENACAGARHFKSDQLIRARPAPRGLILCRGGRSPLPQAFGLRFRLPTNTRHPCESRDPGRLALEFASPGSRIFAGANSGMTVVGERRPCLRPLAFGSGSPLTPVIPAKAGIQSGWLLSLQLLGPGYLLAQIPG